MPEPQQTTDGRIDLDPETVRAAANRLDSLAARIDGVLARVAGVSEPAPAAADEVSRSAAHALSDQAGVLRESLGGAAGGVRTDAADLRRHAEAFESTDQANAERFREVRR